MMPCPRWFHLLAPLLVCAACSEPRAPVEVLQGRFQTLEGFSVEKAAPSELVGSVVNMTFDASGRPALAIERGGIRLLEDRDGDGIYDSATEFCDEIHTAHGMHYLGPGDLLVNAEGPQGTGLYRLTDRDGDDRADEVRLIAPSDGAIAEHGPHEIQEGPDGYLYVLYGNHARPDVPLDPASPSRNLREDHLLPRYLDPRGHANKIRAPGGTLHRLSPDLQTWSQLAGGFRNPFDFALDAAGELFTFEADMEWDLGLPWFKPIRVLHVIPGGDYGWRTGSSKFPGYYIDTLPSVDEVGRGSPTGVAFYSHHVYPEEFRGALFMGDWSRGRIRAILPEPAGASFTGGTFDFLVGEPLNVTDLDIGPDGFLYFATGGRMTTGGIYRVRYDGLRSGRESESALLRLLDQPMPRSAWGRQALREAKVQLGDAWEGQLAEAILGPHETERRLAALEALQVLGPQPRVALLEQLAHDSQAPIRAGAALLMGTRAHAAVQNSLEGLLSDADPVVLRRTCEALVRSGLETSQPPPSLVSGLFELLDHEDRFVRYAARLALTRTPSERWWGRVDSDSLQQRPRGLLEGILAQLTVTDQPAQRTRLLEKLARLKVEEMQPDTLLNYLRVLQLTLIRTPTGARFTRRGKALIEDLGARLLARFPSGDARLDRELQVVTAFLGTPGAIEAMLAHLRPDLPQEEQIHTVYCLRAIQQGWTRPQRERLVEWFEEGWRFRGAASMQGFIDKLWESVRALLPESEAFLASQRRERFLEERARKWLEIAASDQPGRPQESVLLHMSFQELSEYLELDPMSYARASVEQGRRVFYRARCVSCHVFGSEGRGGGPDLSTVVKRFRRSEILESIMYPSKVISDQYTALELETRSRDRIVGMLAAEDDTSLVLIDPTGERLEIAQGEIVSRNESDVSIMPEGLLDLMTLDELVSLIVFLERGSDPGEIQSQQ